ncbi:hypothetical protein RB614_09130 [Phytohabitans sp. ZYX-F-186]|uniref:Uncharacterized protein n=1 Tax=Phytohabitans maris TaxID=3071409 RepID=A0ABU0ZEA6_9ACTN|nr:hypothetical protein [Phytohabitans sp. ZYX-F-186]MDQ7904682.1 hypothetical protein [Phytohabitans sp. ZYX-F-186]
MGVEHPSAAMARPYLRQPRATATFPVAGGGQPGPRHAVPDTPPPSVSGSQPRYAPAAAGPQQAGEQPSPAVDGRRLGPVVVRNRAVDLLLHAGGKHAEHVWESRGTAVAVHAVMFLYADPQAADAGQALFIAPRYLVAGPESAQLAGVLAGVTRNALHHRLAADSFDARIHLATNAGRMPDGVVYAGTAISTLDTDAGPFTRMRRLVSSPWEAPGRCLIELVDGTRIAVDRNPPGEPVRAVVRSTSTLEGARYASRPWTHAPDLVREPRARTVWWLLHLLHLAVAGPEGGGR